MKKLLKQYLRYLTRPFQLWANGPAPVSYAMSIEAVPNKNNWIIGSIVSFVFECDVTKNTTTTEDVVMFGEHDAIFTADRASDDEDVREALIAQTQKYINLPNRLALARQTINTQVHIEAIVIALLTLATIALPIFGWIAFYGY